MLQKNGLHALAESQGRCSMNEYRCTRSAMYQPHISAATRQGHYVLAIDKEHAHIVMSERFPGEHEFTIDLHKQYDAEGIQI